MQLKIVCVCVHADCIERIFYLVGLSLFMLWLLFLSSILGFVYILPSHILDGHFVVCKSFVSSHLISFHSISFL